MGELPVCSGAEAVRAFERLGWGRRRQSGSHIVLTKPPLPTTLSVPNHRELDRGTLRGLIRKSGATVDEFLVALRS
ncbi:MAG: type II toxin-antitoxin system HicA family toxin [Fimbriimonadales bacterium]